MTPFYFTVLLITQCLSLMPVVGIRNPNPFHLKFRVKSKAMIPAFLFLFFGSFFALFYIKDIFRQGLTAKNLGMFCILLVKIKQVGILEVGRFRYKDFVITLCGELPIHVFRK